MDLRKWSFAIILCGLSLSGCQANSVAASSRTGSNPPTAPTPTKTKSTEQSTTKTTPKPTYQPKPVTLSLNSQSQAVLHLQKNLQLLHDYSYPKITSYFGVYTEGAVMTFQFDHHLATSGIATPALQQLIAHSVATGQRSKTSGPYHIIVKETIPERLYLYQGNQLVLSSLCNTGIAGARTPIGSFPIYLKYTSQTMRGQNPNGTYYVDPGIPWINYFDGGDAVHGFVRQHYGFPQSVGCVELPPSVAKQVFERVPIGTIVTVDSGPAG